MRAVGVELLALALAFGCSSSNDGSGRSDPASGSSGLGGSAASAAGAVGQAGAAIASGGSAILSGGASSGEHPSGGNTAGGASGSSSGGSLQSSGGTSAGAGAGGRANGGSSGSKGGNGGNGGTGGCVQNLACKVSPPPSTGDIYQDCVDRINQFLTQCACLPPLTRRKDGEACADQMAEYDASMNSAHAGAIAEICKPGGSQNECPGYSSNTQVIGLCMQQMWDEGPPPSNPCNGSCYEEHGHFINMTDKGVTKVACGFYTTAQGKVWAVQNFTR
ncbi:MAG TPA: hypothetical protein VFK05_28535 [Polyangiaceae bacterium]|nr:hypothetical protein [Polyangiaceae bacterium]